MRSKLFDLAITVTVVSLVAFLVTGCKTAPTVVTVEVPVSIPCQAEMPARPIMALESIALDLADPMLAHTWTRAAMADLRVREAYEKRLVAELQSCM